MFSLPIQNPSIVNPEYYFFNLNSACNTKLVYRRKQHKLHTCRKCHVHGAISSLKGHIICPYKNCACAQCSQISILRSKAKSRKRRKKLVRLEETHHANKQPLFNIPTDTATRIRSSSWRGNSQLPSVQDNNIAPFRNELGSHVYLQSEVQQNYSRMQQAAQCSNTQSSSLLYWINLLHLVNCLQHPPSLNSTL